MNRFAGLIARFFGILAIVFVCLLPSGILTAHALEPVRVSDGDIAIDLTDALDRHQSQTGSLQISTAPDANGIVRRIEVRSEVTDRSSYWSVFALANTSDQQIDRLIVAPHYRMVGSGLIWPDLDSGRIKSITPSEGFTLDRKPEPDADVFLITLDPGVVITFVAEQEAETLTRLTLWEPSAFVETQNSYTLYHGIILGISGLLAIFLTILFVVRGSTMFPATALVAWGVLAYVCIDFGFWNKVTGGSTANNPFLRAATEVYLCAGLLIFLHAYLVLNRWSQYFSFVILASILSLIILLGVSVIEPEIAAGLARFSMAAIYVLGSGLLLYLATQRSDRAIMLFPTWILLGFWLFGAMLAVTGRVENDIIQPALVGGLVLFVLLLAFTIMQHALRGGVFAQGLVSDSERAALALTGSGDFMWDWEVNDGKISVPDEFVELLNLDRKFRSIAPETWQNILHPNDRDKFANSLKTISQHKRGRISQALRIRGSDGHFHWFRLRARPLLDVDGELSRCIGSLTDITHQKKSEERLLNDSIRDHLTGLENQEMFLARLRALVEMSIGGTGLRPTVIHLDIDNFRVINNDLGYNVGDTILLTIARRLSRLLGKGDSLARLSGDQFAVLLVSETEPNKIAAFAENMRRSLKAPIEFAGQEISLSPSIGLVSWTHEHASGEDMMRDVELATLEAKRTGGDVTVPFVPQMRSSRPGSAVLREELKIALDTEQVSVLYQPIVRLEDNAIIGFEALMRWQHPDYGLMMPIEFVPIAEQSGLIGQLGRFVLNRALSEFGGIRRACPRECHLSVNISSRELLKPDLVNEITTALEQHEVSPEELRFEVTESLVMENPEYVTQMLSRIRELGIGLSLDDFGTGYSSLSYLMRFPFDTLKIDKSFIQSRQQREKLVILNSVINLARGLDMQMIAEGIEYEADVADLLHLGCDLGQGYYFGMPVTAEETINLLKKQG